MIAPKQETTDLTYEYIEPNQPNTIPYEEGDEYWNGNYWSKCSRRNHLVTGWTFRRKVKAVEHAHFF